MDPLEQYLTDKSGETDPLAAYLDDAEGGPESFLSPKTFTPSPAHRKFKNTGPITKVREELNPNQVQQAPIGDLAAGPLLSTLDRASFGGLSAALRADQELAKNPIARAVDAIPILGPLIGKHGGETAARSLQSIENYRGEHPTLSQWTDAPAYFMKPTQAIAEGVEQALPRLAENAPGLARAGRAAIANAGTNAVISGNEAAARGEGLAEGMGDVGRGYAGGLATGAAAAVPMSLLGMAARMSLGSRGAEARRVLESHGVDVGLGTPGRGGPMESMATKGTTDADIGRQAEVSAQRGLDMLNQEKRAVLGTLGRRFGSIANTPEAQRLHDVSDIVANLKSAVEDIDISPQAEQSLRAAIDKITKEQGQHFNPDVDPFLLSEIDLNKLKRRLDRAGKSGLSTDEATHPVRQAANETRDIVNEGPFAQANADYAREAKNYQESRGLLGVNKRPKSPEETKSAVNTVRHLIERPGQNTVTAGGQAGNLAAFKEKHPDIGEELSRPEILRKRADISFHLLPQKHGGLIDRTGSGIGGLAAVEALSHLFSQGHVDPVKVAIAGALGLGTQNINAINARLLYKPAQEALRLEPMFLEGVPLLQAARNSMEQR